MHKALVHKAIGLLEKPRPVRRLGLDEARTRSVRWVLGEAGRRRTDPWMTSFVDLDTGRPGGLLGLIPGRSGAAVEAWLNQQSEQGKAGIGWWPWTRRRRSPHPPGPAARDHRG